MHMIKCKVWTEGSNAILTSIIFLLQKATYSLHKLQKLHTDLGCLTKKSTELNPNEAVRGGAKSNPKASSSHLITVEKLTDCTSL